MGYAIIKDTNSIKGYALNRLAQNVVPVDSNEWIYIPNTNSITFSYTTENVTDGIYRLATLSGMENYRLPYVYELVGSPTNVSIDPISGVITVQEGFAGNSVSVKIKALYNVHGNCYPTKTGFDNAVSQTIIVLNISAPSSTPSTQTYSFSNVSLSYGNSNVSATGGAVTPTLNYTLNKTVNGTTSQSEDTVNVTYSGTMPNSNVTLGTNGKVTFPNNNTDDPLTASVTALLTAPDGSTANANGSITLDKRTLNSISFKSYNGANTIVLENGDYFDPALLSLNLTYNTGSATLAAGQGQITYAINSMMGTLYATRRQMFEGTYTIYFWYNNQYNTVSVTVNAPASGDNKAYITGLYTEDPFRGYSHFHESSQTYTYEPKSLDGGIAYPINVVVSNAAEPMTLEEYNTLQTENPSDYEAYSSPVVTYSTNKSYSNLATVNTDHITYGTVASRTNANTLVPLYSSDAVNYAFDATLITSLTIPCTTNSNAEVTATNLDVKKVAETGELLFDSMFEWTLVNTFDDINGRLASEAYNSSTGKVHISSASGDETVEKYIKKLDANTEYFIKFAIPSGKNEACFAVINTGTSNISSSAEYTVNNTTTFYRYLVKNIGVAYVHYITDNTNTYIVTRDPSALVPGALVYIGTWKRMGSLPDSAQLDAFINKDSSNPIAVDTARPVSDSSNPTSGLYIGSVNSARFHKIITPSEAGIYFYKVSSTNENEAAIRAYATTENLTETAFGNTSDGNRVAYDGYTYKDASECIIVFNRLNGKGSLIISDSDGNANLQYKEVLRLVTQS